MFNRRTVITFDKFESWSYHLPQSQRLAGRCEDCCEDVTWLIPMEVVALTGWTLREIFRRIEAGEIHCIERVPGEIQICPTSVREHPDAQDPTAADHTIESRTND